MYAIQLGNTIKFINFRMPETLARIYLKSKHRIQTLKICQNGASEIAGNEDPDQTTTPTVV